MSFKEKQEKLIERLLEKTLHGQISWSEGIRSGVYQTSFPNSTIKIEENEEDDICISIFNEEAKLIESFRETDLPPIYSMKFRKLYENARRIALGAEKVLDDVLALL